MKSPWRMLPVVIGILALCCCLEALIGLAVLSGTLLDQGTTVGTDVGVPAASVRRSPTAVSGETQNLPTRSTSTAAPTPTNTLVIQPGTPLPPLIASQMPASSPYNVVVPTPVAPVLKAPVTYETKFTVVTYPVSGKTLNEIRQALNANAVPDPHEPNSQYYAKTDWHLAGNWLPKPTVSGCELDRGAVSIAITMTLPALASTTGVPSDVMKRWDSFISNTITHETGHVRIALDGARRYQREMSYVAPISTCGVFDPRLSDLFQRQFAQMDQESVEYDAATRHGMTQGAVFP